MLKSHWGVALLAGIFATVALPLAIARESGRGGAEVLDGLTAEELAVEPPDDAWEQTDEFFPEPVAAADAADVSIAPVAEAEGYFDEQGRYVIDLIEQDYVYFAIEVATPDGRPVEGAEPTFSIEGTSQLLEPADVSMPTATNQYGIVEFAVVAGQMGLDRIEVRTGGGGRGAETGNSHSCPDRGGAAADRSSQCSGR